MYEHSWCWWNWWVQILWALSFILMCSIFISRSIFRWWLGNIKAFGRRKFLGKTNISILVPRIFSLTLQEKALGTRMKYKRLSNISAPRGIVTWLFANLISGAAYIRDLTVSRESYSSTSKAILSDLPSKDSWGSIANLPWPTYSFSVSCFRYSIISLFY